jgi:hypothetical protein
MARPASGPSISATAMARFISTIGEPVCWGERLVQGGDLPPVAGLMQVQVRDGRLDQAGPGAPSCHGPLQRRSALIDLPRVPQGTVLVVEGGDLPVAQAGRFAGIVQQPQRGDRAIVTCCR